VRGLEPITRPRAATARLFERIFGIGIDELLSPVTPTSDEAEPDLRQMRNTSRRVDSSVLALLGTQLDVMRQLDRQLGAIVIHDEVTVKLRQVRALTSHSLRPGSREQCAALLSEIGTLAGWQALDLGQTAQSWEHDENAKTAARESELPAFEAHASAEQAFVLLDLGETAAAVDLLTVAYRCAEGSAERVLRAWLTAALGEALAAHGERSASLQWFDQAEPLLPAESSSTEGRT
jgi:hypothetical protein